MKKIKNFLKKTLDFFFQDKITKYLYKKVENNICIDLGAAVFEHTKWKTFLLSNKTKWIAVDPDQKNLEYLKYWRWKANLNIENIAASANGGMMNFYETNIRTGSSLKKINISESMEKRIDKNYFFPIKQTTINTVSVKDLINKYLEKNFDIFIKIDIQGYGLDILKSLLYFIERKKIIGIEVESSLYADPVYENASKFSEISQFLEKNGFELINLKVINLKKNTENYKYLPNECDAVFSLKQDQFKEKSISSKINLICFYNCYKLYDEIKNFYSSNKDLKEALSQKKLTND